MLSSWSIRWLLVFDNYENPNGLPNIADFIPQNELGAILVTSRHADSDALVLDQNDHVIKLDGLDRDSYLLNEAKKKIMNLRTQMQLWKGLLTIR